MRIFAIISCILVFGRLEAQKPVIDMSILGHWPAVGGPQLSRDGRYIIYGLDNVASSKGNKVLAATDGSWTDTLPGGEFSGDGKWLAYSAGKDSLCLLELDTRKNQYVSNVSSFQLSLDTVGSCIALADEKGGLMVRKISGGNEHYFPNVGLYQFYPYSNVLIWRRGNGSDSSAETELHLLETPNGNDVLVWKGISNVESYSYDQSSGQFAFITKNSGEGVRRLWNYKTGLKTIELVNDHSVGVASDMG